jgi:hypothetical protein
VFALTRRHEAQFLKNWAPTPTSMSCLSHPRLVLGLNSNLIQAIRDDQLCSDSSISGRKGTSIDQARRIKNADFRPLIQLPLAEPRLAACCPKAGLRCSNDSLLRWFALAPYLADPAAPGRAAGASPAGQAHWTKLDNWVAKKLARQQV